MILATRVALVMGTVAYKTHSPCMGCGLQICTISSAVDQLDHMLTQDPIRCLRILQHRQAPTVDHHRPPHLIMVGVGVDLDNLRLLVLSKFCVLCPPFSLALHMLILLPFIDRLLLIDRITSTHKMFLRGHNTRTITVISMGHQITTPKAHTMDRPTEVVILGSEEITQTKVQVAVSLDPDLPPTIMGPRTVEVGVTSAIHNGLRPDLVAVVVRRALLRAAMTCRHHRLVLCLQMSHYLLG